MTSDCSSGIKVGHMHLVTTLSAATSLWIALLGFPSKGLAQELPGYRFFHTPSKNIWCAYRYESKTLRCDVKQRAWKDWGCKDYGCFGTAFVLPNSGKASPKRVSDTVINTGNTTIGYGNGIRLGAISCKSEATGLTCRNESGGSLHLNREFFVLNK